MLIYTDIETLPTDDAEAIAAIAETITPPGNYKKADTIAAWEANEKPDLVKAAVAKTSFDGTYGRILAVGWAIDSSDPECVIGAERDVLEAFFEALAPYLPSSRIEQSAIFVGHNISGFDLRFLWQRAVINKLPLPATLAMACRAKAWDRSIADTMLLWNPERDRRISLDRLCRALGVVSPKGDMDGSKVHETYLAGDLAKIADYCKADIVAVRECYSHVNLPVGSYRICDRCGITREVKPRKVTV